MNESQRSTEKKPSIIRRTVYMTGIWIGFGIVVGAFDPRFSDTIGTIAAMIAWSIMLSVLGVLLGLFGGSYKESAGGAVFGAAVAVLFGFVHKSGLDPAMSAIFGLLMGGIIGATCLPWLHTLLKTARLTLRGVQWIIGMVAPSQPSV